MDTPTPVKLLSISGTRSVGKDTLYHRLRTLNPAFRRYAFADAVRNDLAPFIQLHYGFDIWNCTPEEKEIARPLLIAHGMGMRAKDELHWVKIIARQLESDLAANPDMIGTLNDGRFINECTFFRDRYGEAFKQVNVTRVGSPTPTDEEEKHYRQVAAMADRHLSWGNDTEEDQLEQARILMERFGIPLTPTEQPASVAR